MWRCEIKLGYVLPLLLVGSSLTTNGWAQRKGSHKTQSTALSMQAQSAGTVSVVITGTPDGSQLAAGPGGQILDVGAVSYGAGARVANVQVSRQTDRFVVTSKFGLSIQDPSRHFSSASVMASLAYPDSIYTLWLDGVKLTITPQLIQGQARLGTVLQHRLQIEVPVSSTEKNSQLHNAVVFQVIPN